MNITEKQREHSYEMSLLGIMEFHFVHSSLAIRIQFTHTNTELASGLTWLSDLGWLEEVYIKICSRRWILQSQ